MADVQEKKQPEYIALKNISGKAGKSGWTIIEGRVVSLQILSMIGGAENAVKSGIVCLKSEYENVISAQKKKDDTAIEKGEKVRADMIKERQKKAKAEQLAKAAK